MADFEPEFAPIALLNDDTTEVGAVHLGAVYVADAAGAAVAVRETDKLTGSFAEPAEVAAVADATSRRGAGSCSTRLAGDEPGSAPPARPMIRRVVAGAAGAAALSAVTLRHRRRRAADDCSTAPRAGPDEAGSGPALDALGGEIVRFRSRDGLRLAAAGCRPRRGAGDWASRRPARGHPAPPRLHAARSPPTSSSTARSCAGRRASSASTSAAMATPTTAPTTFGLLEVEDVAGRAGLARRAGHRPGRARRDVDGRHHRDRRRSRSSAMARWRPRTSTRLRRAARGRRAAPRDRRGRRRFGGARARGPDRLAPARRRWPPVHGRAACSTRRRGALGRRSARRPSPVASSAWSSPSRSCSSTARPTRPSRSPTPAAWPPLAGPAPSTGSSTGAEHSRRTRVAGQDYERRVTDFLRMAFARSTGRRSTQLRAPDL